MSVTPDTLAGHEAGHAVMRWLRGFPCTGLLLNEEGGLCAGTGRRLRCFRHDYVLVLLAGFAVESGYGFSKIDWSASRADDLDQARTFLNGDQVALEQLFEAACEQLFPHAELVETIAERLESAGTLSARAIAAMCREYAKRERRKA